MKTAIITITIMLLCAGGGAFYFYNKNKKNEPISQQKSTTLNVIPSQSSEKKYTNSDVIRDFKIQIAESNNLILDEPVVVSDYAIETWSDENKGGQALLKYSPSQGWVLLTMGGGAWSVVDLTKLGVPKAVAVQLLK